MALLRSVGDAYVHGVGVGWVMYAGVMVVVVMVQGKMILGLVCWQY